ncbi:MAG: glycosyltransferase family 2 protein [Gemmatimonadales bacterium]|nr:glycosyltransferase family 2 protein [Gemmatimonadales bacterium]
MITALDNPSPPLTLPPFRLFAVLGTWMEADVVAATVRNAFTQGCSRVYLVDNGSTDDTVSAACAAGAILAHSYTTERYDENVRLDLMNKVVADVSASEPDEHIWWLFLDADEFPHGPWGMSLHEYLETLDQQFRIVGFRFFDHYPSADTPYVAGQHPLPFQPLCEELAYPMCPANHRKHSLQRFDRQGSPIRCGRGFHSAECADELFEPLQPAFIHHFPFRDEHLTRSRLEALWSRNEGGTARAEESHDTHMLARFRSLQDVYAAAWDRVVNFISLDPMYDQIVPPPPAMGVTLHPWNELIPSEHQPTFQWGSTFGAWQYQSFEKFNYGDDTTYLKGMAYLDGRGTIEDWGCGFAHARQFVTSSRYVGLDGSSQHADQIVDLREHVSKVDCIFMRHVLEHNVDWRRILDNALASFTHRMVLVVFTPEAETTRVIATSIGMTSVVVPDIAFRLSDITERFDETIRHTVESLTTDTQYGVEYMFYLER